MLTFLGKKYSLIGVDDNNSQYHLKIINLKLIKYYNKT
ncbi:hypothetical protein H477_4546 [[Clostridium] sordellii ATCC 9714]|nr:hypothetical protein H477_4546 [[Clostridium] sordellii ATCC 9714] [Paeniclostridium sordellii ATCC 9714]